MTLITVVLIILIVTVTRLISSHSLGVEKAEYRSFTESVEAEALVIRGEQLISAPAAGYFRPYYTEGSKVAAGAVIGAMCDEPDGEGKSQVSSGSYSGMVSFRLDGWEELLNAAALDSTDRSALVRLYTEGSVATNAELGIDSTAAGRTVAKLVDNFQGFHLLLWLEQPPHQYVSNGKVSLIYDTDNGVSPTIKAQVEENGMLDDGNYYLLLNVSSTISDLLYLRHLNCSLLGGVNSGVLLPEEAVVVDESGEVGVWTVSGKNLVFCTFSVKGRYDGGYLTDDIQENTLIVTVPSKVRPGMKYYG